MTARGDEPTYATASAVAGLASELERLKRRVEPLGRVPGNLEQLADRVEQLATDLAAFLDRAGPAAIPSWLVCPDGPEVTGGLLAELVAWLDVVFLRYPDGLQALPDCWLWHPHVVEELMVCQHFWLAAYQGRTASVALAADWHDRCRPGVVRRVKTSVGTCSLENHATPEPVPTVPIADAVEVIARWWARQREQPAPAPSTEHYNAVTPRTSGVGRR